MSAKPAPQTTGPTFATRQLAPDGPGQTVLATTSPAPGDYPRTLLPKDQVQAAQPILLRLPTVMRITGLAKSTIYKLISQNQFPVPIKLSARAVAWRQSEIEGWATSRLRSH